MSIISEDLQLDFNLLKEQIKNIEKADKEFKESILEIELPELEIHKKEN